LRAQLLTFHDGAGQQIAARDIRRHEAIFSDHIKAKQMVCVVFLYGESGPAARGDDRTGDGSTRDHACARPTGRSASRASLATRSRRELVEVIHRETATFACLMAHIDK